MRRPVSLLGMTDADSDNALPDDTEEAQLLFVRHEGAIRAYSWGRILGVGSRKITFHP